MTDDRSETSDLLSFENESTSTIYKGSYGHNAKHFHGEARSKTTLLEENLQQAKEIAELKVINSQLQSEIEKQDEIIQQQATKLKAASQSH